MLDDGQGGTSREDRHPLATLESPEKNERNRLLSASTSRGGGILKRSSPTDHETILLALRQDLEAARKRAAIASAHFDEVVKKVPSGVPYPDSTHRIQKATSEYAEAQSAALAAQMRLNEFLIYGTLPPGLEKEQEPGHGCDGSP
jgi:hypothetical protein